MLDRLIVSSASLVFIGFRLIKQISDSDVELYNTCLYNSALCKHKLLGRYTYNLFLVNVKANNLEYQGQHLYNVMI